MRVTGACLNENDRITCIFHENIKAEGIYLNGRLALCVSPKIPKFGNVSFEFQVTSAGGPLRSKGTANFFSRELCTIISAYDNN